MLRTWQTSSRRSRDLKRESIRKTLNVLAMVLDHYAVQPNPVRDKRVKLPREEKREVSPADR